MKKENPIDQGPQIVDNERVRPIEFVSEGRILQGTMFFPEQLNNEKPGLLFIHGSPSRGQAGQLEYADAVAGAGYVAMTFDLSGHGTSQGDSQALIIENLLNDATAAYDRFVAEEAVDPKKITAVGTSLGAYLALLLAQRRPIENLAFQNPANFPDDILTKPIAGYVGAEPILEWAQMSSNASLKAVHRFEGNILIVESEFNEYKAEGVAENYIKSIKDASRLIYKTLPGAKHYLADPLQRMQYQNTLLAWLQEKCPTKNHE